MDETRKSLLACVSLLLDYDPMRECIAESLEMTVEQVNPSLVDSPEWPTIANSLADYVEDQFCMTDVECVASIGAESVNEGIGDPDYYSCVYKLGPIFKVTENLGDMSYFFGNFEHAYQQLSRFADVLYDNELGDEVEEWRYDQPTDETGLESNEEA